MLSVKVVVRGKKIPNLHDAADIADLVSGGGTRLVAVYCGGFCVSLMHASLCHQRA